MFPRSSRIALGLLGGLLPLTSLAGLVSLGGITPQTSIPLAYTNQCIKTLPYSLYEGQSFRISETETPDELSSSREMLNPTNVRIFNPYGALGNTLNTNTLGGLVPGFTYRSNGRPGIGHFNFGGISTILVYKQVDSTYAIKPTPTPTRSTLSSQVVHNLHRRQLNSFGSLTNTYTMTYIGPSSTSVAGSFTSNPNNDAESPVNDFECQNFYIAKCGDGVQDNPNKAGTATTDGKNGIMVNGSLVSWSLPLTKPTEECDGTDGVPAGYTCSPTCTLVQIPKPTCTLSVQPGNVTAGTPVNVAWNIIGTTTNTPSITANTTTIMGIPFLPSAPQGTNSVTPQSPGNFLVSLTVSNPSGSTTCTAPLKVIAPAPSCTLTPAQQTITCGQSAILNFDSTFTTSVSNLVHISGGIIMPNQAGRFNVSPTQTTNYSFTVNGGPGSTPTTCTATVNVSAAPQPTCTLTPASQSISAGQNALINFNSTFTTTISNLVGIAGGIIMPNQAGRFNVSPTQTTNYSFTVNGGACTVPQVCTATVAVTPAPPPALHVTKTLISDIAYHSGDLIGFKISFSNTGTGIAHHVVLTDTLPLSLSYVSSSLQGVLPPYNVGTSLSGGNTLVSYSGFDLAPGQSGYMIITGRLLSYSLCNRNINVVSLESQELPTLYGADDFLCYTPSTNLSIVKTINKNGFSLGESVQFNINITNNGPDIASNVQIGDLRPNTSCIIPSNSYTSNYPLTVNNGSTPYLRTLIPQLPVGGSLTINLSGTVANNPNCAGSYLNTGTLSYTINGIVKTGQSVVPFVVTYSNLSVSFVKSILQAGSAHGDSVTFALDYVNNGNVTLDSYSIVDYRPSTLTFLNATPFQPNSQLPMLGGSLLNWSFTSPLAPNATGRIIVTGKIN